MNFYVASETKSRIARIGPVRTFGDFDGRKKLTEPQLESLFDERWAAGLGQAVNNALPCDYEVARLRLQGRQVEFLRTEQEQRQFRYQSMDFIVQLNVVGNDIEEVTQLWKVQSGDDHPKTLFVTFDTVSERKRFKEVADFLRQNDEALGLQIIRDFISKFDEVLPSSEEGDS